VFNLITRATSHALRNPLHVVRAQQAAARFASPEGGVDVRCAVCGSSRGRHRVGGPAIIEGEAREVAQAGAPALPAPSRN